MTEDNFLIDSNILVYAYDNSDSFKHQVSGELIEDILNKNTKCSISVQNLSEFFVIITEKVKNKVDKSTAQMIVDDLMSLKPISVLTITPKAISKAITISSAYGLHYWDALIAAVMELNNITVIYTENIKDFSKVPWIKVVNPFEE